MLQRYKVVSVEELAGALKVTMQEAISMLKELDRTGRVNGVLDDRGKYICILPDEFQAIADYINRQGRVSKATLARVSTKLVDLKGVRRTEDAAAVFEAESSVVEA